MFLCNIKLNGKNLIKITFAVILIVILIIFSIGIYNIFFKNDQIANVSSIDENTITLNDAIKQDDIFEITENNYTDVLQAVTDDVDSYIGCKIHFTGYVYRLIDFKENEFVLARDMVVNKNKSRNFSCGIFMFL